MCNWILVVWGELCPFVDLVKSEIFLRKKIKEESKSGVLPATAQPCLQLSKEDIENALRSELERREGLRRIAQAHLFAAGLASSFGLGFVGTSVPASYTTCVACLAVVYLVLSAVCAQRAAAVMPVYDLWPQLRAACAGRENAAEELKTATIKALFLNQAGTLIVANYASAAGTALRNAIVLIGLALLLAVTLPRGPVGDGRAADAAAAAPAGR